MAEPEQPPPSWAELSTRLGALLGRLEAGRTEQEVADECVQWRKDADAAVTAAADAGGGLTAVEHAAITRTLRQAGTRLAALDSPNGQAVLPACNLIFGCSLLAYCCHMSANEVSRYAACLAFILNSGTQLLESIPQHITPAMQQTSENLLHAQAMALNRTLRLLRDAAAATVSSPVPPQRLLRWWAAAAGALEALERVRGCPGTSNPDLLVNCVEALYGLTVHSAFNAHRAALCSEGALCGRLVRLLLPCLAATAIGLQLPPERRPPGCTWERARYVAGAMAHLSVASGADAALAESGSIARLLQPAAQLAAHAPPTEELLYILQFLGVAAGLCRQRSPAQPPVQLTPRQAAQLVQQLLLALPKFGPALLMPEAAAVWQKSLPESLQAVSDLLVDLKVRLASGPSSAPFSLEDAQAWCSGAITALRLLAPLATLGRPGAGQPADAVVEKAAAGASSSACRLAQAASTVIAQSVVKATAREHSHQQSAAAAAYTAAWQLHLALCRAVHAGVGTSSALVDAAGSLLLAAEFQADADTHPPLAAMSAAHFELLRAVLLGPAAAASGDNARAEALYRASMVAAVRCGPAALAAHPDTEAVLAGLSVGPSQAELRGEFLKSAEASAPVAAHLLHCGVLDAVMQQARSSADRPQALQVLQMTIPALEGLCYAGEIASDAASSATEPSSHVLAAALEQPAAALRAALSAPALARAAPPMGLANLQPRQVHSLLRSVQSQLLPPARQLAAALLQWYRRPELELDLALELARTAATRSCAYLRCANLAGEGGPAAGEGEGSSRCSVCRAVWYCNETCSYADWKGPSGHRRACRSLGAERAAAKAAAVAERRRSGGASGSGGGGG